MAEAVQQNQTLSLRISEALRKRLAMDKFLIRTIGVAAADLESILPSPVIITNPCIYPEMRRVLASCQQQF
jgi:hypothetical protein